MMDEQGRSEAPRHPTRERLSYANVMATIAVFIALGGGAWAVAIGRNDVGAREIAKNAVRSPELKDNATKGKDVDESSLGQVPSSAQADTATSAANATAAATAARLGQVTVQRQDFDVPDGVNGAATVSCLPGQQAIGGGVLVTTASDDGVVTGSRPVNSGPVTLPDDGATFDSWRGAVLNVGGVPGSFIPAKVWVVCAG